MSLLSKELQMGRMSFEVKDEACKGALGDYYGRYVWQEDGARVNVKSAQIHLAKAVRPAAAVIEMGDAALKESEQDQPIPGTRLAVASSIVRLCRRHEEPVVEVVENAIVVADDAETFKIVVGPLPGMEEVQDGVYQQGAKILHEDGRHWSVAESEYMRFSYLPHADLGGAGVDHRGVTAQRPGAAGINFGLLGGEILLTGADLQQVI